jgi:hypothetical protein
MPDQWDAVAQAMRAAVEDTVAALGHTPTHPDTPPAARVPGQVLDLHPWKLTLPTGRPERPTEILQPELDTYSDEWFRVRDGGVVFRARCDGVSTSGSGYPRSELREMDGDEKTAWSNATGSHTLTIDQAITETPVVKPEVVAGQIHDGDDDVIQIHLAARRLTLRYADGKKSVVLDDAYVLGTRFTVRIDATGKRVRVAYNGAQKADLPLTGSGWYWKVGCYTQSSTAKGDAPDAAGEVVVYGIDLRHTP